MKNPLISVIVPIYNVEKYLPDCIKSLVSQTYTNLEIILVDDHSPDQCGVICDESARRDSRISVVHRSENGGSSAARNSGIDTARGEFIFFVDSDDWLAADAIEYLLENMKKYDADCCVGGCARVLEDEDGSLEYEEREHQPDRCESAKEAMRHLLLHESSAWNRLYHREAFAQMRFPEGRLNEDEPVVLRLYAQMKRIVFLEKDTYFYRKRKNSITTSAFSLKQLDCVMNSRENLEFVRIASPDLIPAAEFKYIKTMLWCYVSLWRLKSAQERTARKDLHREIRKNLKMAFFNPYLGFKLKVLALLCMI